MRLSSLGFVVAMVAAAGCQDRTESYHASGDPFAVKMAMLAAGDFGPRSVTIEVENDCASEDYPGDRLCDGSLHFVGADDPTGITSSGSCPDYRTPAPHLLGYDAIAMVVPIGNDWASSLRTAELERIFWSSGRGLRWSDLRPEWPGDEISLLGTSCNESSCRALDLWIPRHRLSRAALVTSSVEQTIDRVAASKPALGWIPLVALAGAGGRVRALPIENESGHLAEASVERVRAGTYPLALPLFLLTPPQPSSTSQLDGFVSYIVRNRARLAPLVGLVPVESESRVAAFTD